MCSCRSYCSLCIGMLCGKTAVTEVSHDVFIVLFSKQYQLVGFFVSANNYCLLYC